MGCSTGMQRSALSVMFSRLSLAMLVSLFAVTLTLPLVRAAQVPPSPLSEPPTDPGLHPPPDEEDPNNGHNCKEFDCITPPPNECLVSVCKSCSHHLPIIPSFCGEPNAAEKFALIAQIALGVAMFVAMAALLGVVYRTCTSDRRSRVRQQRPQIRTSSGSITSADVYFTERLQDCPPCYDSISWEKPPSYSNLHGLQEITTDQEGRQTLPSSPSGELRGTRGPSSPPPFGSVFTVSQHAQRLRSPPANSDDDRGIVFVAVVRPDEAGKEESTDEHPKAAEVVTTATGRASSL